MGSKEKYRKRQKPDFADLREEPEIAVIKSLILALVVLGITLVIVGAVGLMLAIGVNK